MKNVRLALQRPFLVVVAGLLSLGLSAPAFLGGTAYAAGQVTSRSIEISDSTTSATGVSYDVSFTPATTGAKSIIIDFCQNGSIIGSSCTTTNGVDVSGATLSTPPATGTWSIGSASGSTIKLTDSGTALTTSAVTFTLGGITNPTVTGSFFGRIYTYECADYGAHTGGSCTTAGTAYSGPQTIGSDLDYGGFALSTVTNVQITATVMETLTFCASNAAPASGCTGTSAPNVVLGNAGTPPVLETDTLDTASTYTQLSTNAVNGAIVRLWVTSSGNCAGLSRDGGTSCDIGAAGTKATIGASPNDGLFGLQVADGTGGTGSVTANTNYNGTGSSFTMRESQVLGTYGDPIEASTTACSNVNSQLTYGADAKPTTPAGVYSTTEALIATGTF